MQQRFRSVWTPKAVVASLHAYRELADALDAALLAPGDEQGGGSTSEPGSAMEKIICRKADLDLAIGSLPPKQQVIIRAFFCDGHLSARSVSGLLHMHHTTVMRYLVAGVRSIAERLCDVRSAAGVAEDILRHGIRGMPNPKDSENRLATFDPPRSLYIHETATKRPHDQEESGSTA